MPQSKQRVGRYRQLYELLKFFTVARHQNCPQELNYPHNLVFVDYDKTQAVLYDLRLLSDYLIHADGQAGLNIDFPLPK